MSNYLEVDSKLLEKNLLLQKDSGDAENFEKFLRLPENYGKDNTPWKLVSPTPGICVKTTDSSNKKVFINLCKIDDIPKPREITEAQLLELWESEDVPDFRVPLSIQDPHDELDKSGNPTVVYDVAVNSEFFEKIQSNLVFQSFVLQVIFEGLENKYDIQLKKEGFVILKNRKCLGELRPHRIRTDKSPRGSSRPLIEEVVDSPRSSTAVNDAKSVKTPDFRFFENPRGNFLIGQFHLPKMGSFGDATLNVGSNRIALETLRSIYALDVFLPVTIDELKTAAQFNRRRKILTVKMPIVSSSA